MARFGRHEEDAPSVEGEEKRLRAVRLAAEEELARLRGELAERVAAVERKERELADALASVRRSPDGALPPGAGEALTRAQISLAARAQELAKHEADIAAREQELRDKEKAFAERVADDPTAKLAALEERLVVLKEAESAFARTQAELAARSDVLARREADVAERERAMNLGSDDASREAIEDLEERLHRLEVETHDDDAERSFGDGLRRLERKGSRGTSGT